jgi:hypothetical protein
MANKAIYFDRARVALGDLIELLRESLGKRESLAGGVPGCANSH